MKLPITAPYKCRPLAELINIPTVNWTTDEKSAFAKFKIREYNQFALEWENICNLLNPNRLKALYP